MKANDITIGGKGEAILVDVDYPYVSVEIKGKAILLIGQSEKPSSGIFLETETETLALISKNI